MKKVLLCILDGFGYSNSKFGNAVLEASYLSNLIESSNTIFLDASGESVGLPSEQFGNSEVGHLTIGSGRILKQKLSQINDSIESGKLEQNPKLGKFLNDMQNNTCHLMGLFSEGGVHSDIEHFFWAINFLRKRMVNIKVHIFLDGRDVGFRDGLRTLRKAISSGKISYSEIATIQGRFYAMDRDKRLNRTRAAYDAIVYGMADWETSVPLKMIENFYNQTVNDEIMPPIVVYGYHGAAPKDSLWMLNFRADRIKQILKLFTDDGFHLMNMVDCGEEIDKNATVLFPLCEIKNTLGEVLSKHNIRQLRIAETEKYAHVTYFFNGGKEIQYELEDRILIPSPAVKDYTETPEMAASQITEKITDAVSHSSHQVIIANYANADMLGHTGNFEATKSSLKFLDKCISDVVKVATQNGYMVILTADHGNAESMINDDGTIKKTHTCSLVPFITIPQIPKLRSHGNLSDIAPTILTLLGIEIPEEMTGIPLCKFLN
jgi:2,3-bisphosphoglycerate-independent phosphoglycerate mutase